MQRLLGSVLLCLALLTGPALAADAFYLPAGRLDFTRLLAPPPAAQSDEQKRDLAAVLDAQRNRTPQSSARAVADNDPSIFRIAGDVLGPNFAEGRVPKLGALFDRAYGDVLPMIDRAKDDWSRPRPFVVSSDVHPIGDIPTNGSYPSGHSTAGYLTAIILADMVPEKSAALFARGREYGDHRVVVGVHYPTDVEAGRIMATAIAAAFMQSPAFRWDFGEAKAELREALGLPPQ